MDTPQAVKVPPPSTTTKTSSTVILDTLTKQVTSLAGSVDSMLAMHRELMSQQSKMIEQQGKTMELIMDLLTRMTVVESKIQSPQPMSTGPTNSSLSGLSPQDAALSAALTLHADKDQLERKSKRLVAINIEEEDSVEDTAKADQQFVESMIAELSIPALSEAYRRGEVTHHRHPERRYPNIDKDKKYRRPLKIALPSAELRNTTLAKIRYSARLTALRAHNHSFIRRDLCPSELALERTNKKIVYETNQREGKVVCGMRDHQIIYYAKPRDLNVARD